MARNNKPSATLIMAKHESIVVFQKTHKNGGKQPNLILVHIVVAQITSTDLMISNNSEKRFLIIE